MSNNLDGSKSVSGNVWKFREFDERAAKALSQQFGESHGLSEILCKVLAARGVHIHNAEHYLSPNLKNSLPDPLHYKDMERAANRVADAVQQHEKIAIFGDYDVDGATAASVLKRFFTDCGADSIIHIPDRIEEGYGPNEKAIQGLWDKGARVLITVDCGTVSYEPLAAAKRIGFATIVVDHHIGGELLPEAFAVINPNRLDETSEHKHLAACGMSFMLAVAVSTVLRSRGYFKDRPEPNLLKLLDLVALGTICDVMPLHGINRAFVTQGVKILAQRGNLGLAALADVAGLSEKPGVFHLGFMLGPRINAGGRIGEASLGARLLTTSDPEEAKEIAQVLNKLNEERRAIESLVEIEATKIVERDGIDTPLIMPVGYGWHQGVVGIVASRLKDRFHKPVAVVTINDGIAKASSRSIPGVDLGAAIASARDVGLLLTGGGHAMAAGFTAEESKLPALREFLYERLRSQVSGTGERCIKLDGVLGITGITTGLATELGKAAPYGTGNSEPRFVISNVRLVDCKELGNNNLRLIFDDGGLGSKAKLFAVAFRVMEGPLGQYFTSSVGHKMNIAARIRLSQWQGRDRVETQIDDAMPA